MTTGIIVTFILILQSVVVMSPKVLNTYSIDISDFKNQKNEYFVFRIQTLFYDSILG